MRRDECELRCRAEQREKKHIIWQRERKNRSLSLCPTVGKHCSSSLPRHFSSQIQIDIIFFLLLVFLFLLPSRSRPPAHSLSHSHWSDNSESSHASVHSTRSVACRRARCHNGNERVAMATLSLTQHAAKLSYTFDGADADSMRRRRYRFRWLGCPSSSPFRTYDHNHNNNNNKIKRAPTHSGPHEEPLAAHNYEKIIIIVGGGGGDAGVAIIHSDMIPFRRVICGHLVAIFGAAVFAATTNYFSFIWWWGAEQSVCRWEELNIVRGNWQSQTITSNV